MHYLIERGFTHEEADTLANAVRDALSKREDISKRQMSRLVEQMVGERYGERHVGDLVFWERMPTSITVERAEGTRPFSKELLSHSIQASGLAPDQAYHIARSIESSLIDQRCSRIGNQEMEDLAEAMLAEIHGKSYAGRYKVWRTWAELRKPLFILIGGASGVGKTSLAVSLAHVLDIPRVVATDDIRQIMRLMLAPDLMPSIHASSYAARAEAAGPLAADLDPTVVGFRDQAKVVSVGVRAILSRCLEENVSVIIDGVHLLPEFIDLEAYAESAFPVMLCLTVGDREAYEERFAERGVASPARPRGRYLSHLDDIMKIQQHIVESNLAVGLPVMDTETVEDATSAAVRLVVEHLQEQEEVGKKLGRRPRKKKKRKS